MVKLGLLVRLEAKPEKVEEVEKFLKSGLGVVQNEPETMTWYGIRLGPTTFGVFDTFYDEIGRADHLNGVVGQLLVKRTDELFSQPPAIEMVDILAAK